MAINANGIPLYHKVEEKPEAHYTPNSMLIDNDKNLIIAGITKTKNESWFAKFTKIKEYIFIRNFGDINSNVAKYQEKTKLRDLKRRESLQPKSEAETKKSDEQKEYQPSELKKRERRR